jgi:prepilin-type N-terminal cleavage/methylation domain-containing protein
MTVRHRHFRHRGFTLLELVLVLLILCIALAAAAPALTGWGHASKVRDAGDQFLAVARWARTAALADAQVYRLNVDSRSGTYWLTTQNGTQFVPLGSEFGRIFNVPDGFAIAMTTFGQDQQQTLSAVDFLPNGRTTPARVRIGKTDGDAVDLECPSPAEGFRLAADAQEVTR